MPNNIGTGRRKTPYQRFSGIITLHTPRSTSLSPTSRVWTKKTLPCVKSKFSLLGIVFKHAKLVCWMASKQIYDSQPVVMTCQPIGKNASHLAT